MQLHLFSTPGSAEIKDIVAACGPLVRDLPQPQIAYLPAASLGDRFTEATVAAFAGLAAIAELDPTTQDLAALDAAVASAAVLYIPGGNTFVLRQRLHAARWWQALREAIVGGLPLVAFSAGAMLCGQDILAATSPNVCGCTEFAGWGFVPWSFAVHFPAVAGTAQAERAAAIADYQQFFKRSVLALSDGAYVAVGDRSATVVRGPVWLLDPGQPPREIAPETTWTLALGA